MPRPIHAVVLAGGAGERFWPRSRRHRPKPFLALSGGATLLEATLSRARRFAGTDRVWIVCGPEHARAVRAGCRLARGRVLVEPRRRNTAMAVGLAAARIAAEDPDAVLAVLPADHRIPDARAFAAAIRRAADAAAGASALVTLGVQPTRPDTGYGYIEAGAAAGAGFPGLRRVKRFVEKPDLARARRFLRRGGFFWNAGIFVWTARTILDEIEACAPELHRALAPIRKRPRGAGSAAARESAYRRAPSVPIDIAVLERSRRVWTLPVAFHWSDVGTWLSLAEELGVDASRSHVIAGESILEDARGNLVWGDDGRLIALLGVSGLAVIDAGDALLVAKLDSSPDVRRIVGELRRRRRGDLT
ncbi:MAG: mannose-1-phosphate guanylyltransferase [Deltaproteobacteria bacterium]|nr:MAG: mannose-1-phosphate guanylyltransferase [Deltaproteobacteria bacterium]